MLAAARLLRAQPIILRETLPSFCEWIFWPEPIDVGVSAASERQLLKTSRTPDARLSALTRNYGQAL